MSIEVNRTNMYKLLILSFAVLLCFGCGDGESEIPDIPNNVELDLDEDGIPDFVITYILQTEGDPVGNYKAIRMHIESFDIDQVLKNEDQFPIFLSETGVIAPNVAVPFFWETTNPSSNVKTPIATIRTDYDEVTWNDEWTVFTLDTSETYLIGFKLINGFNAEVGFIEFSVDLQSGRFNLLKTEFL